jgi:hypothetical protein
MATAIEAPRQALEIPQHGLPACALFGPAGSQLMVASQR